MDKKIVTIASVLVVGVIFGAGVFLQGNEKVGANGGIGIVSRSGLHWHANIEIIVKGKNVEVPPNIGLEAGHNPVHTHDNEPNVIHMEFPGIVRQNDLILGEFFRVWKKDIRSFGENVKMTVNGAENIEFEKYHMKDKDKIVLKYE